MKVLHVHSGNLFGGVETILTTLAEARGEAVHAFALCYPGRLSETLSAIGAATTFLGAVRVRYPWTVLAARRHLARHLAASPPDIGICHSAWSHALFAPVLERAGVPRVFWLHNRTSGSHWLERWAARHPPQGLLCVSRSTAETAHLLFPDTPAQVIYAPLAIPAGGVPEREPARRKLLTELACPPETVVLVQVSRLEPWKGHADLLAALARLEASPPWVLCLVGGAQRPAEERYRRQLEQQVSSLGLGERVRFLGERSDVAELLAGADLFCQANRQTEGFSIAFLEAFRAGLPLVTTALGSAAELVTPECGVLVPAGDVGALASTLAALVRDRAWRERLGRGARTRLAELCDVPTQIEKLEAFLAAVSGLREAA